MNLGFVKDFFTDIRNFFSFGRVLGVDIGTVSIKLVELARKGDAVTLENYGMLATKEYLKRPNAVIQSSSLKLSIRDTAPLLKTLVDEVKPKARKVFASVPAFASFAVPIEIPLMSREETEKSIGFQAQRFIPMPVSEVSFEWEKVGEYESAEGRKSQRILLVAVPNEIVKTYRELFHAAGLTLVALEVEHTALARAVTSFSPSAPAGSRHRMIVDIGAQSTAIVVTEGGMVRTVGTADYGAVILTQALARNLGVSEVRAEELKKRRGLMVAEGEYELSTSLLPFLDVIIRECERVRASYERTFGRPVERFTMVGGGANLLGIERYFAEALNIPHEPARPFARIQHDESLEPAMRTLNHDLAIATGLALKSYSALREPHP
ncbi:MAG: type IV pilus assembly protein PilM [Candidatus Liptonbacteria bacterium]|nr:type IV pilus assembly protein PilM [Candidatus Liptonbacteria bacterium]